MKLFSCIVFLLVALNSFGAVQKRDTVELYNGQKLIGEIRGVNAGILSMHDADLGILKVKLYKIMRISSPVQYRVVSISRAEYYGYIAPGQVNGHVSIILQDGGPPIMLAVEEINNMLPIEKTFFQRLTGNVTMGFTYAKSSDIGQMNISGNVIYTAKEFENRLTASQIASIDSNSFSRDNEEVELLTLYNVSPTWFASLTLSYERNLELGLSRRFEQIIGGGNKVIVKKNFQLLLMSGLSFDEEVSTSGVKSNLLLELPFTARLSLYKFSKPNLQINSTQTAYISMSQKGRVRYSGSTSFYYELFRDFYLNFTPYTNFDSKPPNGSSNKFDFGLTFGISFRF